MIHKMGHKNFTLLAKMMDLHAEKHRIHAQNIANVNTPHYRRRSLNFEGALRQAMAKGHAADYGQIEGTVERPNTTLVRNNGNNVDIDQEIRALSGNSITYQIYTDLYARKSRMVKAAIKGGF